MSWSTPPHRLRTIEDACAYARRLGRDEGDLLVSFARCHTLSVPPILQRLPEKIDLPLYRVCARRRAPGEGGGTSLPPTVRAALVGAALVAPNRYDAALGMVAEAGESFLKGRRRGGQAESRPGEPPGPCGPVFRMLSFYEDVPKTLAAALRDYLNTRREEALAFLRDSLFLLLLYVKDPRSPGGPRRLDHRLAELCAALDLEGPGLPAPLHARLRATLGQLRWEIFRPFYLRFLSRFRESVHRVPGLPTNLKTNAFSVMRQVVDGKRSLADARADFRRLTEAYAEHLPAGAAPRFGSVLDNFFEKLGQADRLFDEVFAGADGRAETGGTLGKGLVIAEESVDPAFLTGHFTKDYLDLLKGLASGDCTAQEDLRGPHLLHPRFFNIRLFHRETWVGNVYALDFTDRSPATVVLDKIQCRAPDRYLPEPVLRGLIYGAGADPFREAGVRLIAPAERISNASWLRDRFARVAHRCVRTSFGMGPAERFFESSRAQTFVVLADPPLL